MDQINSNSYFNTANLYQSRSTPQPSGNLVASTRGSFEARATADKTPNNEYSSMFDDDALMKLQSNLETIAKIAEESLKRIAQ